MSRRTQYRLKQKNIQFDTIVHYIASIEIRKFNTIDDPGRLMRGVRLNT